MGQIRFVDFSSFDDSDWSDPRWMVVCSTDDYDPLVYRQLIERYPGLHIFGIRSFMGVFTPSGFLRGSFGLLFEGNSFAHFDMRFVRCNPEDDFRALARECAAELCKGFDASGEALIMHGTPGYEERIIEGILDVTGDDVHIYGATAASDSFTGEVYIFYDGESATHGFLIGRLNPMSLMRFAVLSGYLPTRYRGVVTRSEGRVVYNIDNRPALDVYNLWTERILERELRRGGLQSRITGMYPLGRVYGSSDDVFWLSHLVYSDRETGSLTFYSEIEQGVEVVLMRGSEKMLVHRMKQAVDEAIGNVSPSRIRGAILIYCAGCTDLVQESTDDICNYVRDAIGGRAFLGFSSFGEQGRLMSLHRSYHGNLMCGVLLFLDSEGD